MKYLIILFITLLFFACDDKKLYKSGNGTSLSDVMTDYSDEDFDKAVEKREFIFPDDHGPHPNFRTEWWYFTGNLVSDDDREFGFQFTIFRTALTKSKSSRFSGWSSNQIYMAHFALTDISNNQFYFDERFSREGNNLAGAQINPFKFWIEDWQIIQIDDKIIYDLPVINLNAKTEITEVDLIIKSAKPLVLQGDEGLSQKGSNQGNASYYYSYTRLKTEGKITLQGEQFNVTGYSWMDREWSTSALKKDQSGWDWFALQLDDNTEIMYYQMRKKDGTPDIFSKGIFVDQNGLSELLKKDDVLLNVTDYWESPYGERYPSGWNMSLPSRKINLKIVPTVKNQLMDAVIRYWEGAVKIYGTKKDSALAGKGYVELTGY